MKCQQNVIDLCFIPILLVHACKDLHVYVCFLDVWKLDVWNAGLYCHGHHSHIKGKTTPNFVLPKQQLYC